MPERRTRIEGFFCSCGIGLPACENSKARRPMAQKPGHCQINDSKLLASRLQTSKPEKSGMLCLFASC